MMLARNAESLYWIGRYVERADDMARILDVAIHQILEDTTVDVDRQARLIIQVLGLTAPEDDEELDVWSLTERVAYDADAVGSIVDLIRAARENARGAREVTSSELWECLNTTYNGLDAAERRSRRLGPHEFLSYVKNRAAMFAGLADATLSHDDGYRYLLLGRSVERVDMTIRMLLSRAGDRTSSPAWVNVLVSAGGHDTFLRTYRGVLDAENIVEFMLLDRLFPRSIFHALSVAEHNLGQLEKGAQPCRCAGGGPVAPGPRAQFTGVPRARQVARRSAGPARRPAGHLPRGQRSRDETVFPCVALCLVGGRPGERRECHRGE